MTDNTVDKTVTLGEEELEQVKGGGTGKPSSASWDLATAKKV